MNIYLEFKDDTSAKFWKIAVTDTSHTVTYGKIGTNGQSKTKTFESAEKAIKDAEKLVKAKTKKGYQAIETEAGNVNPENKKTPKPKTTSSKSVLISQEEAMERFNLDQYDPLGEMDYDSILVLEGDTIIETDVTYYSVNDLFFNGTRASEEELIIVNGNLTIKGDLKITDGYPCFLVLGDLHCDLLYSGDNMTHITGDAFIKYVYNGNYNHGCITIEGKTTVPYLLNSDHASNLNPSPKTILINYYNNYDDSFNYDYYSEDIPNIFVKGLANGGGLDLDAFIKRVKSGKSPFKSGVKPSRILVENEIKKLAKKSKSGEGLKELDLSEKKLLKLPAALFELESLEVLNLSKNNFSVLPNALGKLIHLKELNLVDTNIKKLPDSIGQLKNLEVLNLYNCRNLESLPESIGQLENLKVLSLYYCTNLETLPESIGDLSNLKELKLQSYEGKVPSSISKLTSLEELNISDRYGQGTQPVDFPSWICELKGLKRLYAGSCKFKNLPESLSKLPKLEALNLSRSLSYFEEITDLSKLENLKELHLTGGAIESLYPPEAILQHFYKIKSLERLYLGDFGKVKLSVNLSAIENRREELKDQPERLADLESRIKVFSGYTGSAKKLSMHKYKDDPVKLEEDKKRLTISNARYEYQVRNDMSKQGFKGLEQLVNLKELDVRGIILGFLPEEFTKLPQLQTIRCYSNIFPEEDIAKLEALGIAVTR